MFLTLLSTRYIKEKLEKLCPSIKDYSGDTDLSFQDKVGSAEIGGTEHNSSWNLLSCSAESRRPPVHLTLCHTLSLRLLKGLPVLKAPNRCYQEYNSFIFGL